MRETENCEFKKSTSELDESLNSIAAILNKHKKGELYFGLNNNGELTHQIISEKTLRDISQKIANHIEPKIYPLIEVVKIKNVECIKISFQGEDQPYYAFGRPYIRIADEDRQLSAKELENIILEKNKDKLKWDTQICKECSLSDISESKIKIFLEKSNKKFDSLENALQKLGLLKNKKLVNPAIALFGKKPELIFPNLKLRCAVFGTKDTSLTIDMQDFSGDLFFLIDEAEKYILKNIHIGMKLDGLRRVDVPEIDKEALREAIINAFCHRDYWKYDSVNVAVFTDRVEIRNPGLLYGGLTIDKIKKENISERRNELIAEMFHLVHYVEKWGRGISLILSKEPKTGFKEVGSHFVVVFKRKGTPQVELTELKDKKTKGLVDGLVESQIKIIELISNNPRISKREISEKIGISTTAIDKHIQKLKEKGMLKRIGHDKGGHWEIIKK